MNATRRKLLADILDRLSSIKAEIDELKDLEQEAFDNLPEGIQASDRGEKMRRGGRHRRNGRTGG